VTDHLESAPGHAPESQLAQSFLEFALDAIVIVDAQGRIVLANARMERLFGYSRAELLGEPIEILLPEQLREAHAASRDGYLADPQVRTMGAGLDLLGRRRDGSEFPADVSLAPLETEQGVLVAATICDLTERRRADAALSAANAELEAFSYSVSHDLRAPLRSINGFSTVILEDYGHQLDPEARALFERVRAAAERMGQLIDDLLGLAGVGRAEMRQQAVDLSAIAREVTDQLREQAPGRDVVVRISDDALARGDRRLLRVALENLLHNAWKFTGDQPRAVIEFGAGEHDGHRVFFVRDNGAGFDMAYAHRLFGAFQRLHAFGEFEGNGIGLATVQRIVRRHGGQVWAEGAVGEGATFTFTLASGQERE
jgi:PAS domain S-box-containing protein